MILDLTLAIIAVTYLPFVPSDIFIATAMISILLLTTFVLFLCHPCRLLLTCILLNVLLDLFCELLFGLEQERCCFVVQRVCWVRIHKELGKERVEYVFEVEHRGPSLVDYVETDTARPVKAKHLWYLFLLKSDMANTYASSMFG